MELVVMKFGGTSVQDVPALRRLIDIVVNEPRAKVVVVSALAGVTDALQALGTAARDGGRTLAAGQQLSVAAEMAAMCDRHVAIVKTLVSASAQQALIERLKLRFAAAAAIVDDARGRITPRDLDVLLAIGELASSEIIAAVLADAGLPAAWTDARQVIVTDNEFGRARPDAGSTRLAAACTVQPLLDARKVPVMGGFVAATVDGLTTTLGRGGSDYSAALVAAALGAHEIQIWTDVDGVLSADPRVVTDPVPVPYLTFHEAYELARFGAKVLHWGTLEPAAGHRIPVHVLNARRPQARGTRIDAARAVRGSDVAALALQRGAHVIDLAPSGVTGSFEFLNAAASWLGAHDRGVTVVSLSPARLAVAAPDAATVRDLAAVLRPVAHADVRENCDLVTMVGPAVVTSPRAWSAVGRESAASRIVRAIPAQSGNALVCLTPAGEGVSVFRELHVALVHGASPYAAFQPALTPLETSTDTRIGTQSIVGA